VHPKRAPIDGQLMVVLMYLQGHAHALCIGLLVNSPGNFQLGLPTESAKMFAKM